MGLETKISWTDSTFNPWRGCTKVSAGCLNCYAERQAVRNPEVFGVWGKPEEGGRRVIAAETTWDDVKRWDRRAAKTCRRHTVFCGSMCDVFEGLADLNPWRERLWDLIADTPALTWLLLTKRPMNIRAMMPRRKWHNVWLGATIEGAGLEVLRTTYLIENRDKAAGLFISCEPLLGPLPHMDLNGIGWLIAGGESGLGARPCEWEWLVDLKEQCAAAKVPFFCKQLGSNSCCEGRKMYMVDPAGRDMNEWPEQLRIQETPWRD